MKKLRVADLFCGPGGISEGFQLAGCEVVYGLDHNADAVATFQRNHPSALAVVQDATTLDSATLPDFDILVGGPPCVNFSSSKGSRANVLEGLRLVQTFLRVVYERAPAFWIMENVPRVALHLPPTIPLRWFGIDKAGDLAVPVRHEFNCADYGVPQSRKRYLIGNYPVPRQTHFDPSSDSLFGWGGARQPWMTLAAVLKSLPDPADRSERIVTDPNYRLSLPSSKLADHFHPVILDAAEAERIKKAKTAHPYMGYMHFPDPVNRPARTVVATQLGRETLVLATRNPNVFRRATVRECATIQTFPISFHFCGKSLASRYRQAGDAVPPKLSFAVASVILAQQGLPVAPEPQIHTISEPPPAATPSAPRKEKTVLPLNKRCCELVPGKEVRGCRIELDNQGQHPSRAKFCGKGCLNVVEWVTRLHLGEGKGTRSVSVSSLSDWCRLLSSLETPSSKRLHDRFQEFASEVREALVGFVPDATTFQAVFTRRSTSGASPQAVASLIAEKVDTFFPKSEFGRQRIAPSSSSAVFPTRGLLVRIAAGGLAAAFACDLANQDTRWLSRHKADRFVPENWPSENVNTVKESVLIAYP